MAHAHFDTYGHRALVEPRKVGPSWMMLSATEAAQLAADLIDAIGAKPLEVAAFLEVSA